MTSYHVTLAAQPSAAHTHTHTHIHTLLIIVCGCLQFIRADQYPIGTFSAKNRNAKRRSDGNPRLWRFEVIRRAPRSSKLSSSVFLFDSSRHSEKTSRPRQLCLHRTDIREKKRSPPTCSTSRLAVPSHPEQMCEWACYYALWTVAEAPGGYQLFNNRPKHFRTPTFVKCHFLDKSVRCFFAPSREKSSR